MFYKFDSIKMHFFNNTGGGEAAGGGYSHGKFNSLNQMS